MTRCRCAGGLWISSFMNKFKHLSVFMLSAMLAPALAQDLPEANPDPVLPEPSGVPLDSVVAIVNEGVVLQSELDYLVVGNDGAGWIQRR